MNYKTLSLSDEFTIIPELDVAPDQWHFGEEADISECNIDVRISEEPISENFFKKSELDKTPLGSEYQTLYERFDLWLIKHSIGIIDRSKSCDITEFGYKLSYEDKVQILEMTPQTKFIKPKLTGGFQFQACFKANGEAAVPEINLNTQPVDLALSADMNTEVKTDIGLVLSMPALSPLIQTSGQYSKYGEWSIKKDATPLVGDQILTHIILAEKGLSELKYKCRVYCNIKKFGIFNTYRESDWTEGICKLG